MKKILFIIFACLVICSCSTTTKTFPLVYTHSVNTEFEILGTIFIKSPYSVGYNTVFEEAKKQYPSTDFIIDIMIDQLEIKTEYNIIARGFRALFGTSTKGEQTRYEYVIRGTAIQYIRRDENNQIITTPTPSASASVRSTNIINTAVSVISSNRNTQEKTTQTSVNINETRITPAVREITNTYTVVSFSGNAQYGLDGKWVNVDVGDTLYNYTFVRTLANSSLVITDGINTITIPSNVSQRIESIIKN